MEMEICCCNRDAMEGMKGERWEREEGEGEREERKRKAKQHVLEDGPADRVCDSP